MNTQFLLSHLLLGPKAPSLKMLLFFFVVLVRGLVTRSLLSEALLIVITLFARANYVGAITCVQSSPCFTVCPCTELLPLLKKSHGTHVSNKSARSRWSDPQSM